LQDLRVDGRIVLKCVLQGYVMRVWTGFICHSTDYSGGFLWKQYRTYRFHKQQVISLTSWVIASFLRRTLLY